MNKIYSTGIWILLVTLPVFSMAQKDEKAGVYTPSTLQRMIEEKEFVFVANSAIPLRGRTIPQLNYPYDLRISGDSVVAELPYFGRAFVAPIDPTAGGIRFISTTNEYIVQPRKKGGWDIIIKPTPSGRTDVRQLALTVFDNGQATLRVTNTNRDPISFHGYIVGKL
jgi:hypothetical protein